MTDRTVTVAEAQIRWGYYTAGVVRACTVTRTEGAWRLSGSMVESDATRLSQRPLTLVVTHTKGSWRWPITELQIAGAALSASLGPPEY